MNFNYPRIHQKNFSFVTLGENLIKAVKFA